jgi:hypothetical protein
MAALELIKNIGSVVGVAISCITLCGVVVKPIRNKVISAIKNVSQVEGQSERFDKLEQIIAENTKESKDSDMRVVGMLDQIVSRLDVIENKDRNDLRRVISDIYYTCLPYKKIPAYKHKLLVDSHAAYDKLHGNNWEHEIYSVMMGWEVVSDDEWQEIIGSRK